MIAIYRCLYGEDFIQASINSIDAYVDKIFIFWDDRPWGNINHCVYKGEIVNYPKKFDNILDRIKELNNDKIELIYDHKETPKNQLTLLYNQYISHYKPEEIMIIEVDHVFRKDQIELALKEFRSNNYKHCTTRQIEIWKGFHHRIPERKRRCGVNFWNMKTLNELPETGTQGNIKNSPRLNAYVHNLGFACSEEVMYWKHLTAIGFSKIIKDTIPSEEWYEKKWLKWKEGDEDLAPSKNKPNPIRFLVPYSIKELPEEIYEKVKNN